jgi:hypothetical protein
MTLSGRQTAIREIASFRQLPSQEIPMSVGWIKVDCNLHDKPEVLELSAILGLPVAHVVGCLIRIWTWFDQHTEDGNAVGVTYATLDRYAEHVGFAEALGLVGWLMQSGRVLSLPNFDRHNGKSAKKRAVTADRVAVHRTNSCNAASVTPALPEKRREENKDQEQKKEREPRARGTRLAEDWTPSEELLQWAARARPDVDARFEVETFRNYWTAKTEGATKLNWPATWRNWILKSKPTRRAEGEPSKTRQKLETLQRLKHGYEGTDREPASASVVPLLGRLAGR